MSGTRDETASSCCARVAAVSSLILGIFLLAMLPDLFAAAGYLGVLTTTSALVALVGGAWLWFHDAILPRMVVGISAMGTGLGAFLLLLPGLPGARVGGDAPVLDSVVGIVLSALVGAFLAIDMVRHRPAEQPDHPYALEHGSSHRADRRG